MLFFQVVLLAGYAYAHVLPRRASPRMQAAIHLALLATSVSLLPVVPSARWKPLGDEDPAWRILGLLAATIGLPYFLLATTGPLVQHWLVRRLPDARPYRLFALGNLAALGGLLAYPFVVRPALGIASQARWWSVGYGVYAALVAIAAVRAGRRDGARRPVAADVAGLPHIDLETRVLWVALAACPSVMFLAVTEHLTRDVAPVPFLWILPLSLYLLTFVLAFDRPGWYRARLFRISALGAFATMVFAVTPYAAGLGLRQTTALFVGTLFVCCMTCHGELARLAPPPTHLTRFYLLVSLGGAIGGIFVGLVAPAVFSTDVELPIAVSACVLLVLIVLYRETPPARRVRSRPIVAVVMVALVAYVGFSATRVRRGTRTRLRNFFGVIGTLDVDDAPGPRRVLSHGIVVHGVQFLDAARRRQPTSYYGRRSGVAVVLDGLGRRGPIRVGVIGLGAGVLATYGRPGDSFRFYEINPLVVALARLEFSFLADSPARVDVVVADGRLALEREPPHGFDVLVLDAFSGDSIPVHLLTREAFVVYERQLRPGGVIAVNVSNRYLDLAPIVASDAHELGRRAVPVDDGGDEALATAMSQWVLVVEPGEEPIPDGVRSATLQRRDVRPWTDDYSDLLAVVR
jgi:spermidine synthase